MVDNKITIIDLNNNSFMADGISYVRLISNNKNYAFYTLNEFDEHGLNKIYIADANEMAGSSMPIDDMAYEQIKQAMIKITSGTEQTEFEYLPMNGKTFYVGMQKKLVIKPEKVAMLKDDYNKAVNASTLNVPTENLVESVEETPIDTIETSINNIETPVLETPNISETPIINDNSAYSEMTTSNFVEENNEINETISYDEAVEALNVLNKYFKQTKTLPSEIATSINSEPTMTITEPVMVEEPVMPSSPVIETPQVEVPQFDPQNPFGLEAGMSQDSQPFEIDSSIDEVTLPELEVNEEPAINDFLQTPVEPINSNPFGEVMSQEEAAPIQMDALNSLENMEPTIDQNTETPIDIAMPESYQGPIEQVGEMITPNTLSMNLDQAA